MHFFFQSKFSLEKKHNKMKPVSNKTKLYIFVKTTIIIIICNYTFYLNKKNFKSVTFYFLLSLIKKDFRHRKKKLDIHVYS